jgi:hypothetical protein
MNGAFSGWTVVVSAVLVLSCDFAFGSSLLCNDLCIGLLRRVHADSRKQRELGMIWIDLVAG